MTLEQIKADVKGMYDITLEGEMKIYNSKEELAAVHFPTGEWYDNDVFESKGKYIYCEEWK